MIELQVLGNDAIPLNVTETSTIPLEVTMTTGGGDITVEALSVTANGTYTAPSGKAYSPVEVDVEPNLQTLSKTITPSLNAIIRDYTPDSGYDGLAEVFVTVSGIPQGTAGTPTASKGSVSNHSVEVTPSVTNTTGYITGSTKTGTAVTVSASELVSGTKSITANGTGIDVTEYASVDVNVSGQTINNQNKTITPTNSAQSITADTGYTGIGTASVEAVVCENLTAANIVSGVTVKVGTASDDDSVASVTGTASGGYSVDDIAMHNYNNGALTIAATRIYPYTFYRDASITSVSAPNVTRFTDTGTDTVGVGSYVFTRCTNLTSASFPSLTSVGTGGYQFAYCTSLTTIYFPRVGSGQYEFYGCTGLRKVALCWENLAQTASFNSYTFSGCTNLEVVDGGYIASMGQQEFKNCSNLSIIILRKSAVVSVANKSTFDGTPFANGGTGGTIYIPETMYNHLGDNTALDYKKATNWSTINGYGTITWAKIEGSYYETHLGDDTLIPTT